MIRGWGALLAICVLAGCDASRPVDATEDVAERRYVGSQVCGDCHSGAYQAWSGSHHQRAMLPADDEAVVGDFDAASFEYGGVRTLFQRRDGGFVVNTEGTSGETADFEVRYAFGAEPLQQYLLAFPGGRLQALAIAWDTVGQRWFHLQPEDEAAHDGPLHWSGPAYNWNFMCADCHSTGLTKGYDSGSDSYNTEFAEVSVGCEACHGPGSLHVEWAAGAGGGGTAVGYGKRSAADTGILGLGVQAQQVNACGPCHSRRTQLGDGFTPDQPLLDYYLPALLEPGLYEADGQIDDEVYVYGSFLQSRMFARGVTCGDCHEPHSAQPLAAGDALCTRCHNEAGNPEFPTLKAARYDSRQHHLHPAESAGARCVSCHMPERTYMVVDDRRDHGFRIPRPDLTVSLGIRNACNGCHEEHSAEWARDVLAGRFGTQRPTHFATVLAGARQGRSEVASGLAALAENPEQAAIVRATALTLMESYDDAATALALEQGLRDANPLVRIGALRGAARFAPERAWRRAGHLLDDRYLAVRGEAAQLLAPALAGLPESDGSRLQEALEEHLDTQRFNADRPEAHTNMANAFLALGDIDRAERALAAALDLSADWVPALVNLADLYRATGRDEAGGELLARASMLAPRAADVQVAQALWLVRQHRHGEALPLLARAVQLAPYNPRYAYVHAVALHSRGESPLALAVLDEALQRRPGNR